MLKTSVFTASLCFVAVPAFANECGVVKLNDLQAVKYSEGSDNSVIKAFTTIATTFAAAQGKSNKEIGATLAKQKDPEIAAAGVLLQSAGGTEEAFAAAMTGLPDLISAIDKSSDTPDDLYLSLASEAEIDAAFWPEPGEHNDNVRIDSHLATQGIHSVVPYVLGLQGGSGGKEITVNFWDHDVTSADDHLGSVTFSLNDAGEGNQMTAMIGAKHGGSLYLVSYDVVPVSCDFALAPILKPTYETMPSKGAAPDEAELFTSLMKAAMTNLKPEMGDYSGQF